MASLRANLPCRNSTLTCCYLLSIVHMMLYLRYYRDVSLEMSFDGVCVCLQYKTEKDGIQETRVEHKVVLSSTDDDFDYDAVSSGSILFYPDVTQVVSSVSLSSD